MDIKTILCGRESFLQRFADRAMCLTKTKHCLAQKCAKICSPMCTICVCNVIIHKQVQTYVNAIFCLLFNCYGVLRLKSCALEYFQKKNWAHLVNNCSLKNYKQVHKGGEEIIFGGSWACLPYQWQNPQPVPIAHEWMPWFCAVLGVQIVAWTDHVFLLARYSPWAHQTCVTLHRTAGKLNR